MDNPFEKLGLQPVKTEPFVWINRVVLYERIKPEPKEIREIKLHRGLNIVWANEPDDDVEAVISGHSAGKTTFCRLLRYLLGENTFAKKVAMEKIRKAFPHGHVAAELYVNGRKWAVRRPLGTEKFSYVKEDSSIEELLLKNGKGVGQDSYLAELGFEHLLDEIPTATVLQTGEEIRWQHLLAWCTRDQEARFQNIYDWRSPRSDSEPLSFRYPKSGPLFVMRAALGLFLPEELKAEEHLSKLNQDKDKLSKTILEQKREPQYRVNLYHNQLLRRLQDTFPAENDLENRPLKSDDLLNLDLERLAQKAINGIDAEIKAKEESLQVVQSQIDDLGAQIIKLEAEQKELSALFGLDELVNSGLDDATKGRIDLRNKIEAVKNKSCTYGNILIGECQRVIERQKVISMSEHKDLKTLEQAKVNRESELALINSELDKIKQSLNTFKAEKQRTIIKRNTLNAEISGKLKRMETLKQLPEDIHFWSERLNDAESYPELDKSQKELTRIEDEIAKIDTELSALICEHNTNRDQLAAIFSWAVKSVLPYGGYDGEVKLEKRELSFAITNESAMGGEAVETLSVILADIASIIYNSTSDNSRLPSFFVHDSPREADLGAGIYRKFFRLAAQLQGYFAEPESCPFQYFITTTTRPPEELITPKYLVLPLDASSEEGLLLKKNVTRTRTNDDKVTPTFV